MAVEKKEKIEVNDIEVKEPLHQFVVIQEFRITDKDMQIIPFKVGDVFEHNNENVINHFKQKKYIK